MTWLVLGVIFIAGCVGGLVTHLFYRPGTGQEERFRFRLASRDPDQGCETWFPDLISAVFLGGVAACVFWALYGPFTGTMVLGTQVAGSDAVSLSIGQLATSFLIGMGGATFLWTEAQRRCMKQRLDDPSTPGRGSSEARTR